MIDPRAEASFRQGSSLFESGKPREALACYKAAIDFATAGSAPSRAAARYFSMYGLCICRTRGSVREALTACRTATRLDPLDSEVLRTLGRVAAAAGRKQEAIRAWQRGLELDPAHNEIQADLLKLGRRKAPVLEFLPRSHPLNVSLGRLRSRVVGSGVARGG